MLNVEFDLRSIHFRLVFHLHPAIHNYIPGVAVKFSQLDIKTEKS